MASLRLKVEKLRKQVEIIVRNATDSSQTYPEGCICFPQDVTAPRPGIAPLTFGSEKDLELALSIRCPVHGQRFDPTIGCLIFYEAAWLRASKWASQWEHLPAQHRKALQATFKNRDEYVCHKLAGFAWRTS